MVSKSRAAALVVALGVGGVGGVGEVGAGEVTLRDGRKLQGDLVTMVVRTDAGEVLPLGEGDVLLFVGGNTGVTAGGGGWGARAPSVPDVVEPAAVVQDPSSTHIGVHLEYLSGVPSPEAAASPGEDSGATGEVFAYLPGQDGMRYAWRSLGTLRRVEDAVETSMSPDQELEFLRGMLANPEIDSRETMVARLNQEKTYSHRVRYALDEQVQLPAGMYTVHVGLPAIRRHRKFHGVMIQPGGQVDLEYSWSQHSSFGR